MTQILLSEAALAQVADRVPAIAPGVELVAISTDGSCTRDGRPVDREDVQPDVAWLSLDTFADGTLLHMFGAILDPSSRVQWVQTFNAGLDNPVWKSVLGRGIRLTKSSAQAVPIAEYVLAHALSLLVPVDQQRSLQGEHQWAPTPYREVSQTRWVLVGYGAIGREIAARVTPFGAHLTVVRRSSLPSGPADDVVTLDRLREVLPTADVVVLACASNDDTRGLADEAFFSSLRPGAVLINIARGDLVDESALRRGLDRSQPGVAVLDVTVAEPLPPGHWLWDHPSVRLSGHTSSAGDATVARGAELFLANLQRFVGGEPLHNEASPSEVGL